MKFKGKGFFGIGFLDDAAHDCLKIVYSDCAAVELLSLWTDRLETISLTPTHDHEL